MAKKWMLAVFCTLFLAGCGLQEGKYAFQFSGEATLERQTETKITEDAQTEELQTSEQTETVQTEAVQTETTAGNVQTETVQAASASGTDADNSKKALFRDSDGTIHGPQIGVTESGTPLYDYEIDASQIPASWKEPFAAGVVAAYLSPDGIELYKDADGTIHGPQIGVTESGTPQYDYEFDASVIPAEWR